jgi:hypothetical protein
MKYTLFFNGRAIVEKVKRMREFTERFIIEENRKIIRRWDLKAVE